MKNKENVGWDLSEILSPNLKSEIEFVLTSLYSCPPFGHIPIIRAHTRLATDESFSKGACECVLL